MTNTKYTIRPQPRHLKRPAPVAAPRSPEHAALVARYDAGELTAVALLAAWTPMWDAGRLREAKAGAVRAAMAVVGGVA